MPHRERRLSMNGFATSAWRAGRALRAAPVAVETGFRRSSLAACAAVRLRLCPVHARTGVSGRRDTSLTARRFASASWDASPRRGQCPESAVPGSAGGCASQFIRWRFTVSRWRLSSSSCRYMKCAAAHMAEDFLFIGRGFRRMSRTVEVGPRPVNKKSFVLNRSAGGRFYGH
jgi:hypothetical protein